MFKNKQSIIALIIILIIIAIAIISYFIYSSENYSLQEVKDLLNLGKTSDNIYVQYKQMNLSNGTSSYNEVFMKNNFVHEIVKDNSSRIISEGFYNPDTSKTISIIHSEKSIISFTRIKENVFYHFEKDNFFIRSESSQYKYHGKEKIDDKQCIKVSLTSTTTNNVLSKDYYYIDLSDNHIIKHESYKGNNLNELEKIYEVTYTYFYNTITDDDIVTFDINNYSDYEYQE